MTTEFAKQVEEALARASPVARAVVGVLLGIEFAGDGPSIYPVNGPVSGVRLDWIGEGISVVVRNAGDCYLEVGAMAATKVAELLWMLGGRKPPLTERSTRADVR